MYVGESDVAAEVVLLDDEHDRFLWLPLEKALAMCQPEVVASGLANAPRWIESQAG